MARKLRKLGAALWLCLSLPTPAPAGAARDKADDEIPPLVEVPFAPPDLSALTVEIERAKGLTLPGAPPPYFLALIQQQDDGFLLSAERGAVVLAGRRRLRTLATEVRVGDMRLDSSGFLGGVDVVGGGVRQLPLSADALSVRWDAWQGLDVAYKQAVEVLNRKRGKLAEERDIEPVDDFSPAPRVVMDEGDLSRPLSLRLSPGELAGRARKASAILAGQEGAGFIERGVLAYQVVVSRRTLVTSEGTKVALPRRLAEVHLGVDARAADGMPVQLRRAYFGEGAAELPDEARLLQAARELRREALAIAAAPLIDTYDGPVLFEREAAAQLIQLLIGRNVAANRPLRSAFDGSGEGGEEGAFVGRLGRRVAAPILDVVDDPTISTLPQLGGARLLGGYVYDDEGVRGQRIQVITQGVLSGLLSSRRPTRDIKVSNGHGRAAAIARWPQAAPSNLLVTTSRRLPAAGLRERLLAEARVARVKEALVVRRLHTGRKPGGEGLMVRLSSAYLVSPDGKERPVRGGELAWVSPRLLRGLLCSGDTLLAHTMLLDEDGDENAAGFPVTIVTPPLLLGDVEVGRERGPFPRPRLIPPP